jgi:GNAT superfamily N-acetyltransferase
MYARGIATGNATFDEQPPTWEQFRAGRPAEHRQVAVGADGRTLGWIAAAPVSSRCVYSGVIEHSVYVHPAASGRGVGRMLLDALISSAETAGIWNHRMRNLLGEQGEPRTASPRRLPRRRRSAPTRAHDPRPTRRPVARRGPARTAKPNRRHEPAPVEAPLVDGSSASSQRR